MTAHELEQLSKPELIAIILRFEHRLNELEAEVVAGRAKPARGGQVKTGHLEELVIRAKAVFGPWWTAEAGHGESSQDGGNPGNTSITQTGLVLSTDRPGTGHSPGDGEALLRIGRG